MRLRTQPGRTLLVPTARRCSQCRAATVQGASATSGSAAPRLLADFQHLFEAELDEVQRLQRRAVESSPGQPLLSRLGELEVALGELQRPARFFADFHPDGRQAAAAAALLAVTRIAAAEVYTHPRALAALLATALEVLPPGPGRGAAAAAMHGAAAAAQRAAGAEETTQAAAAAVAALAAAAAALDDALYGLGPGAEGGEGLRPELVLACRQALRAAAAAHTHCEQGADAAATPPHPYEMSRAQQQTDRDGTGGSRAAANTAGASGTAGCGTGAAVGPRAAVDVAAAAFARLTVDPTFSPLLLLTAEQAEVVRPLLRDAGLEAAAWRAPHATALVGPGGLRRGSPDSDSGSGAVDGVTGCGARLRCSRQLRTAPGPGGLTELAGLVAATEAAQEWLQAHGARVPHRGALQLPPGAPLRALVVTRDVLALLLASHPNPDVRRQLHQSGLGPRRRLLLTGLTALAGRRAALASALGAPSHCSLLLGEGSPLREPAAVDALLCRLADGLAGYAANDLADLQALGTRRARRAGSTSAAAVAPWDVDYLLQGAAVEMAAGSMWHDFSDYFTLPGLWAGLDRLLAHGLGLRLLAPGAAGGKATDQAWDAGVWHLQLWDTDPPARVQAGRASVGGGSHRRSVGSLTEGGGAGWRLLGDVFIQVAPPGGFPFTTLLRPTTRATWRAGGGGAAVDAPGAVAVYLPLALTGLWGGASAGASDGRDPAAPERPPALRSPFGIRALLHEAGHAVALLAAGSAAPHPLLGGAGGAGGGGGSVDLRELPSHLFEGWARDPRSLALLSCHWRMGVPLPPRDAARLARYVLSASAASALDLHEAALAAAADARLAAVTPAGFDGAAAEARAAEASAAGGAEVAAVAGQGRSQGPSCGGPAPSLAERIHDTIWQERGVHPCGGMSLEALRGLEASGAVGGAKWGYVVAKLLAAAAWKRWLRDDPLCPEGGRQLKARLLYGLGEGLPPQRLLARLLGDDALERTELGAANQQPQADGDGGRAADGAPPRRVCWVPDLYAGPFQDVDLLG